MGAVLPFQYRKIVKQVTSAMLIARMLRLKFAPSLFIASKGKIERSVPLVLTQTVQVNNLASQIIPVLQLVNYVQLEGTVTSTGYYLAI